MFIEAFRKAFLNWIESIKSLLPGEVVSIDGKTLRRSHDKANGNTNSLLYCSQVFGEGID